MKFMMVSGEWCANVHRRTTKNNGLPTIKQFVQNSILKYRNLKNIFQLRIFRLKMYAVIQNCKVINK